MILTNKYEANDKVCFIESHCRDNIKVNYITKIYYKAISENLKNPIYSSDIILREEDYDLIESTYNELKLNN